MSKIEIGKTIEFKVKYKKPLVDGLNYGRLGLFPYLELPVIHFETGRYENECTLMMYNIKEHKKFTSSASLPNRKGRSDDTTLYEQSNLKPFEEFSIFVVFAPRKFEGKFIRAVFKLLARLVRTQI